MATAIDIPEQHVENVLDYFEWFDVQLAVCSEECDELGQALSKYIRSLKGKTPLTRDQARGKIVEEATHVAICLGMLCKMFDIQQCEVDAEVFRKAEDMGFNTETYFSERE